jgi:cardiolipin synthase A/B
MPGWLPFVLALAGSFFIAWSLLVALFTPAVGYHVRKRIDVNAPEFLHFLHSTCQSEVYQHNRIAIYRNGDCFYPAMLDAIRAAKRSISVECYIFEGGEWGRRFVDLLCERARVGVVVTIVVDAIGTSGWSSASFDELRRAGGRIERYQSFKWYSSLHRLNNRTHREILVVDGRVAFVGGAGIADRWAMRTSEPQWRDMMARIEGPIVAGIQAVFAENWLECCGEILVGDEFFPPLSGAGDTTAFVLKSSPSDRATVSRVAFQLLIAGASRSVCINTPYFLPDRRLREAIVATARRGVAIAIVVPGKHADQQWVRIASRRYYGQLLAAGVRIFEYQPSMIHAKTMIVDDRWSIIGTTNFDNRSFEHNDEVNVVICDPTVARQLTEHFERDTHDSVEVTLEKWRARPLGERLLGGGSWILERQQ